MLDFIITEETVTVIVGARPYVIAAGQAEFDDVVAALGAQQWDEAATLVARDQTVRKFALAAQGSIEVRDGNVYWKGEPVSGYLVSKIIEASNRPDDMQALVNFFESLQKNPSYRMVQGLFRWVEKGQMKITPRGTFIAYKKIRADYTDIHSGTCDNSIGARPFKPRNEIDDESEKMCAESGLHWCSKSYLSEFQSKDPSTDRIVTVEVWPEHVVSFPKTGQSKGRSSEYVVIDEIPRGSCPDDYVQAGLRAGSKFVVEPTNVNHDAAPAIDDGPGGIAWKALPSDQATAALMQLAEAEDIIGTSGPNLPTRIRAAEKELGLDHRDILDDWAARTQEISTFASELIDD